MEKIRIGDLLVREKLITPEQLAECIKKQQLSGRKLGQEIVTSGLITEDQLLALLASQLKLPVINLKQYPLTPDIVRKLPEAQARRFQAIVLDITPNSVTIGMVDPLDLNAYDKIKETLKKEIGPRTLALTLVRKNELLQSFDLLYRNTDEISQQAEKLSDELEKDEIELTNTDSLTGDDVTVVQLLKLIFEDAVRAGASDIHIEPGDKELRIRHRIDGILQEQVLKEQKIIQALTQRLKLMSGLNIAEKRLPQDGRFHILVKERHLDVRLSTMPTQYGESVVMRLLDQSGGVVDLDHVGMPDDMLARLRALIHKQHGMLLVTGPTGSGKTTTLYAALNELNSPEKKIITVEDPIEYRLPRINQVQVNPKIDLSFARVLRAALRQDPDILLVGEIRDQETMTIALRAAMTGHFVFATLHTNDAASSALRLIDMGADSYLVAGSLQGIVAQRLVRRICASCIEPHALSPQEEILIKTLIPKQAAHFVFKKGAGCTQCNKTGYQGRIGVFELLVLNEDLLDALRRSDHAEFMQTLRQMPNFKTLGQAALELAAEGVTTLAEALPLVHVNQSPESDLLSPTSDETVTQEISLHHEKR